MTGASHMLAPWSNFYVMTGSAAASLTGLMFVVVTLVAGERMRRNPDGIKVFSTPTVAHYAAALLFSAILIAPWHSPAHAAVLLGLGGLCGVGYMLLIFYRTRGLSQYTPDLEDWAWYTAVPLLAYAAIFAGAVMMFRHSGVGPFAAAGGVMLLLFAGIHNAWDIVTYLAAGGADDDDGGGPSTGSG
jgi:hypothetical protein